ncbi:hypothetical protein HY501_03610 [Candidatus Woesearchaeota archaeon]|nr:hypothetical protein [Candidatus Woesearchaeota archaeon]
MDLFSKLVFYPELEGLGKKLENTAYIIQLGMTFQRHPTRNLSATLEAVVGSKFKKSKGLHELTITPFTEMQQRQDYKKSLPEDYMKGEYHHGELERFLRGEGFIPGSNMRGIRQGYVVYHIKETMTVSDFFRIMQQEIIKEILMGTNHIQTA